MVVDPKNRSAVQNLRGRLVAVEKEDGAPSVGVVLGISDERLYLGHQSGDSWASPRLGEITAIIPLHDKRESLKTGPEHYQAAQKLIDIAANSPAGTTGLEKVLAAAQVHATLALAAAQALSGTSRMSADDSEEWESVASAL